MTKLGELSKGLYDQCGTIKSHLGGIERKKQKMRSAQSSADSYYNYYSRSRYYSSRRYYYKKYRYYSDLAYNHKRDWYDMISAGRAMVVAFSKSMMRFKTIAKGRDDAIKTLKKNVAEQEVIVTQAIAAKSANVNNVIITYARSNFALLGGIIKSVRESAPKDEAKLLGALTNINNQALAHTDRMTAVADETIKQLTNEKIVSDERNEFQKTSAISSFSNVANDKMDVLMKGVTGNSDSILETATVFLGTGYFLNFVYDKTIGKLFVDSKDKEKVKA